MPMTQDQALTLVEKLFAAFNKEPLVKTVEEWTSIVMNFRIDDGTNAVDTLIRTSNRMPSIAEFRTACMESWSQRKAKNLNAQEGVPVYVKQLDAEYRAEVLEWYRDIFGDYSKDARTLMAKSEHKRGQAQQVADLLVELKASPLDHFARYDEFCKFIEARKSLPVTNSYKTRPDLLIEQNR